MAGAAAAAKLLPGVTHVSPAAVPLARVSSGLVIAVESPTVGGVVAAASLRAENPREGELTVMTAAENMCPMIVGRRTFSFSERPIYGIAKLVWAGISVVSLMSSSGEVLCMSSGLLESADDDIHSNDSCISQTGDSDDKLFVRTEAHAVDICAMTVVGYPLVVAAGHQKTYSYVFPSLCVGGEAKHERRELTIGPFHAVAGVADCRTGPALLLGCTLGSVVVFEWASPGASPVVMRSILMGRLTRYIGISVDSSCVSQVERSITFCAFGGEVVEKKGENMTLRRADGTPYEIKENCGSIVEPLSSWNEICCDAPSRLCVESPSLVVMQPLLYHSTSVAYHALVIIVTQRGTPTTTEFFQQLYKEETVVPKSSIDVRIIDATSSGCKQAFSMLNSVVSVVPILRCIKGPGGRLLRELCLCDGKYAIFFDITDKIHMDPSSVIVPKDTEDYLVGMTWLPNARSVLVLSGKVLHGVEELSEHKKVDPLASVVGHLTLACREPLPWEGSDTTAPLTPTQLRRVVQSVVREENEKIVSLLEQRLSAMERAISALLSEREKKMGNTEKGNHTATYGMEK